MEDFELRELRYFLAVAEELNFSRAAARLGIAQPPLSRAIRAMERRLGADLFERDTRRVALTRAGTVLLVEARAVLSAASAATRRTQRAATPTLVATAKPGAATALLRRIVDTLPADLPVRIDVGGYVDQAERIRRGDADVALAGSPFDPRGLDFEPLTTEPRLAALPVTHPLARHTVLNRADLAGEPVPRWTNWTPLDRAYWSYDGSPEGPEVASVSQMLDIVSLGQAVALVPQSVAAANPRPDLAWVPVTDASPYTVCVAWPADSRDAAIARFVRAALTEAGRDGGFDGGGEALRGTIAVFEKQ
jgi:LysR family transcriptional regulator, benzoate and cis,cis-muconate-responsive activator of ben and cat genes